MTAPTPALPVIVSVSPGKTCSRRSAVGRGSPALGCQRTQLMKQHGAKKDDRLPVLVTLRRYADELRSRPGLSLRDHILELTRGDLGLSTGNAEFFDYHLCAGQVIILLDGLDELPSPHFKTTVRDRVAELLQSYPGNTTVVTSRIVGYDKEVRYDGLGFSHHRVARLSLKDITGFVANRYEARLENAAERLRHATDLSRIINDPENRAIRELAENPLLLTIICLAYRIAVGGLAMDAETPPTYTEAILTCIEAGIPVVIAIGNEGQQTTGAPGNDLFALSVGATDPQTRVAGFSGGRTQIIRESDYIDVAYLPLAYSKPDLSAPGVAIYSSVPGGGWKSCSGTSMATPHVAGAIALLLSATSIKEKEEGANRAYLIQDLICGSVEELGESGQDHRYGFGRLDALRAIDFARQRGY